MQDPADTLREIQECYERAALGVGAVHRNIAQAKYLEWELRKGYLDKIIESYRAERHPEAEPADPPG